MNFNLDKLKQLLNDSPEVAAAYLFGSAAKNEPVVNDLDILILLYPDINQDNAYFELSYRIGQAQNINADKVDLVFFDLDRVDPEVLYEAVNYGILFKNESPELLTDQIETLSNYFLKNESLIQEAKKLRNDTTKKDAEGINKRIQNYLCQISSETTLIEASLHSDEIQSSISLGSHKYSTIVIVETMVQLLQFILAVQFNIFINRYKEILIVSVRYKIISLELSSKLQPYFDFRHKLIYHHWEVDDALFLMNLRDGIKNFQAFIIEINAILCSLIEEKKSE